MPQIIPNRDGSGGIIRYDKLDWISGLAKHIQNVTNVALASKSLVHTVAFNPYRALDGYAFPGFEPVDVTNVGIVDTKLKAGVVHGVNAYFTSAGTELHQFVIATSTLTTPTTFPHTIDHSHTGEIGEDVVVYSTKTTATGATKVARLFYSFNDDTDGDVGIYDFSTTFVDNFMSTVPASGAVLVKDNKHPMLVGHDDILYIGDGNILKSFDGATGADGTFDPASLTLPADQEIISLALLKPRTLAIFTFRSGVSSANRGEAFCHLWDYLKSDPYKTYSLDDNQVGGAFEFLGTIGCFTKGRANSAFTTNNTKMKMLIDDRFKTIQEFSGDVPDHGSVDITGDTLVWTSGGNIYSYGDTMGLGVAFHKFAKGLGTSVGVCIHLSNNLFVVSTGATTLGGLQKFSTGYDANGYLQTVGVSPLFAENEQGKITMIKTKFAFDSQSTPSDTDGRDLDLKLKIDGGKTTVTVFSAIRGVIFTGTPAANQSLFTRIDTTDSSDADFPLFSDLSLIADWGSGGNNSALAMGLDYVEIHYITEKVSEE